VKTDSFTGLGLAVGTVRGLRAFKADELGRLTGLSYEQVWTPGENVSDCRKPSDKKPRRNMLIEFFRPTKAADHSMVECTCGFYAFYDGRNDYRRDEDEKPQKSQGVFYAYGYQPAKATISAVVEGYGETVIGTRGFRAQKAKIVALYIPKGIKGTVAARVRHNYADVPQFVDFDAMLREFPMEDLQGDMTPESDPNFWTRAV